jgi:dimethylamine monooxygenase subunit A
MMAPMSFDFSQVTAPFRMQPGLRRLAPGAAQLSPLPPGSPVFTEKLAVLQRHAEQALVARDGFDAQPALLALARQASVDCPEAIRLDGADLHSPALGLRVRPDGGELHGEAAHHADAAAALRALPPPWRAAGLLSLALHADFAVVDGTRGTLPWMAVCLPSHWDPVEKVGRHFTEVHAPVADNATLLAAGAHLMSLVCEAQRWERFVWTLTPNPAHDHHPRRRAPAAWPVEARAVVACAHLRTERQTFIPLPEHRQAVFTIHVEVQPLAQALTQPGDAQRLHDALASMSEAVLAYRGLTSARPALLRWLAGYAAQPA